MSLGHIIFGHRIVSGREPQKLGRKIADRSEITAELIKVT
jgi:hypothetical protein